MEFQRLSTEPRKGVEPEKSRNAERSRRLILDAAEDLFARKGYEGTSLKEIGETAGLSRGTPAYFFGSKRGVYLAVKERLAEYIRSFAEETKSLSDSQDQKEAIAEAARGYIDFLAARPTYLRFIEREAAGEDSFLGQDENISEDARNLATSLGEYGIKFLQRELPEAGLTETDVRHLAASMTAICSFPFLFGGGLVRTFGLDPSDPGFLEQRKEHSVNLILRGIHY